MSEPTEAQIDAALLAVMSWYNAEDYYAENDNDAMRTAYRAGRSARDQEITEQGKVLVDRSLLARLKDWAETAAEVCQSVAADADAEAIAKVLNDE